MSYHPLLFQLEVNIMANIIIPKKTKKKHREKLYLKKCAFPGCNITQSMTARACYCDEHRHRKYRKIIDAGKIEKKKAEEEARSANQIINHDYDESHIVKMNCKLLGCSNSFEIKIIPNIFCYPKYCPDHRNEYKRKMFLNKRNK